MKRLYSVEAGGFQISETPDGALRIIGEGYNNLYIRDAEELELILSGLHGYKRSLAARRRAKKPKGYTNAKPTTRPKREGK